jgi:HEAT repeat protein
MVFEVYVAGPLNKSHERIQMNEIVYRLHAIFGPTEEVVRLVIDIGRNRKNGMYRQIDGLLVMKNQLVVLEIKSLSGKTITVDFDPELLDSAQETGDWREYRQRQKKWLVDGVVLEEMDDNPLDQVRDQRSNLNWFVRKRIRNNAEDRMEKTKERRTDRPDSSRRKKEDNPAFRLGKSISGFVVINKGEIVYATPIVESYVKSQRWLAIFEMDELAHRIQSEAMTPSYEDPVLTEEEFSKLVELVGAEKRPYHRWLTKPLEHEYTEISRVPYLDFLFDSEDSKNLIRAMEGACQFRLRAYSEDIVETYYGVGNEQVKIKALTVLADWDIASLGDLLVYALERREFPSLLMAAIRHLQAENVYPQTLPNLENLLRSTYESRENLGLALVVIDAIGNLRSQEAGEVVFNFLNRLIGDDFYSGIVTLAENDDPEGQTRTKLEIFSKTLEKIALCRYTKATGLVQRLLVEFPSAQYVSYSRMMSDSKHRKEFHKNTRIHSALDTVLRSLVGSVGDIWDGRGETEIVRIVDDLNQETLREEKGHGYHSLYDSYLKVLSRIGGKESLSVLMRHYDSLVLDRKVPKGERLYLGEWIVEAIGNMGLSKGYDFLAEKLQEYRHNIKLNRDFIITILESLGSSGDPRHVKAISTLLELDETEVGDSQYVKHSATRALARIGGNQSFEVLIQVFLKEPALAFDALRRVLSDSDSEARGNMAKRAEKLILNKFKKKPLLPESHESHILTEVASEESLPLLFELAKDPEWYHRPLPQQIGRFSHIDSVQRKLVEMLESSEEDQRAFAIGVIAGTGCLGEETDNVLSRFKSDPSSLVRCSMIDYYSIIKKDCLEVASFLSDPDMKVRAYASHGLQMITHRGGRRCLVVSNLGWQGVQRMIYNEKGIFFLEVTSEDFFSPEVVEDFESYEPFFLTATEVGCIFVHPAKLRKGESGKTEVLALYLEEKEQDGLRLLVLPIPEDDDVVGVRDWRHFDMGLDTMVSMYRSKQTEDESELEKADELLRLAHEGYIMRSEGSSGRTNGTP